MWRRFIREKASFLFQNLLIFHLELKLLIIYSPQSLYTFREILPRNQFKTLLFEMIEKLWSQVKKWQMYPN